MIWIIDSGEELGGDYCVYFVESTTPEEAATMSLLSRQKDRRLIGRADSVVFETSREPWSVAKFVDYVSDP